MCKNNSGLIAKMIASKFKKRFVIKRKVSV